MLQAYVVGWVIKKIKTITKNFHLCVSPLSSDFVLVEHFIIRLQQRHHT